MEKLYLLYNLLLIGSTVFAAIFGGKTGKIGAVIFWVATFMSAWATTLNPEWRGTSYAMMAVDSLCLLALLLLAFASNRYWPIWATGLQLIAVITHVATIIDPKIVPGIYDSLSGFWSIPILLVMVSGTMLDRNTDKVKMA